MPQESGLQNPSTAGVMNNMVSRADALSQQPFQPYGGQLSAGLSPYFTQAAGGLASMGNPEQWGQATNAFNNAISGLGSLAGYYAPNVSSNYTYNAVDMFGRPRETSVYDRPDQVGMFSRPSELSMYAKPADTQMFAKPADTQMYAKPGDIGIYNRPGATQMFARPEDLQMFGRPDDVSGSFDAGEFDSASAQKYMNPYTQNVTDIAIRELERKYAQQAAARDLQAAARGGFGGSRNEIAQQEAARNMNQNIADVEVKGLSDAYMNAQAQYERDRQGRYAESMQDLQAATQNQNMAMQYGLAGLNMGMFNNQMAMDYGKTGLQNDQFNAQMEQNYGRDVMNKDMFNTANAYQYGRDTLSNNQFNTNLAMQHGLAGLQNAQFNTTNAYNYGRDQLQTGMFNRNMDFNYGMADMNRQFQNVGNQMQWGRDRMQNDQFNSNMDLQYGIAGQNNAFGNEANRRQQYAMQLQADMANQNASLGSAGIRTGAYNGMMQGAGGLASLGNSIYGNNLNRYGMLGNMGLQETQVNQGALDRQYQQYMMQQMWPQQQLSWLNSIVGNPVVSPSYSWNNGAPSSSSKGNSISDLVGLGIAGYGLYKGIMG